MQNLIQSNTGHYVLVCQTAKIYFKMLKRISLQYLLCMTDMMKIYYQNDRCYNTATDVQLYGAACPLSQF